MEFFANNTRLDVKEQSGSSEKENKNVLEANKSLNTYFVKTESKCAEIKVHETELFIVDNVQYPTVTKQIRTNEQIGFYFLFSPLSFFQKWILYICISTKRIEYRQQTFVAFQFLLLMHPTKNTYNDSE